MKDMKTVGTIGGFGPETSASFLLSLVNLWAERNQVVRPEILLWNAPVNIRNEHELITKGTGVEEFEPLVLKGATQLVNGGADFLVMPCNTLHPLIGKIRILVNVPVISILEETTRFIKDHEVNEIGLLATQATVTSGLWEIPLKNKGVNVILPTKSDQKLLNDIIFKLLRGNNPENLRGGFLKVVKSFQNMGSTKVLLGCTDLQLLKPTLKGIEFFDTLDIFSKATVENMLKA